MPPFFGSLLRSSSPMRAISPIRGRQYGQYAQYGQQTQHAHHPSAAAQQQQQQQLVATSGVQVLVRVRPPLPRELMYDSGVDVRPPNDIKVYNDAQEFSGRYHYVFGEETPQADVYEKVRDCVPLALDGYNSTIFAYGQTGTGKTFTMMGDDPNAEGGAAPTGPGAVGSGGAGPGIIPRAMKELFREAKAKQDAEGAAIQVIVSYMEIYNDRLHDLLQPYKPQNARDPADVNQKRALLEVREDAKGNTYVPNLLCVKVKSYKSVYQLISKGNRNRAVRHTEMNQASSRSHAILQLVIEQWPNGGADGTVIRSKLNFVDLAGSERWNTGTGWDGGPDLYGEERVNEMTAINGSLSALGSVVAALTEGRTHVPYRDSRLTHLLQDSLGGNCRTTILATLSPSVDAFEESCSTLRFADRARAIANNPVVNASRDVGSILALKEREIQRLRNMLSKFTGGDGTTIAGSGAEGVDVVHLAEELEATRKALEMERALRAELQQRLHNTGSASISSAGGADGSRGPSSIVLDATTVLSLGTPTTAFDTAGTPPARPGSSLRSSAGSAGSAGGGGGGTSLRGPGGTGGGAAADFFRLSTPSTPLNAVPTHLAGGGSGRSAHEASWPSTSAALTPTHIGGGGGPPTGSLSRSNLLGPPSSSGGGSGPSPPRRRAEMRRLSFDEAIMSIKSQILSLTAQERARFKARQPPQQRGNWGGLPPPPAPGAPPPLASSTSTSAIPSTLTGRTRATVGIYGSSGAATAAAPLPRQQRQPPGLTLAPGVVGPASLGGAGGGLAPMHSIEMTDSPTGSDRPSPGSVQDASAQLRYYLHREQQEASSPTRRTAAAMTKKLRPLPHQQQAGSHTHGDDQSAISASSPQGEIGGGSRDRGQRGPGRNLERSPCRTEATANEDDIVDERGEEGSSEESSEEEEEEERKGRTRRKSEEDDDVEEGEVEDEQEMTEEEVEMESDDDGRHGRQRAAGPRAGARRGVTVRGGGSRGEPRKRGSDSNSGSDSGSTATSSEGGLSQLDPEEYQAIMREAREVLAKGGKSAGVGARQETEAGLGLRQSAAAAAGPTGVGGGRSALLQQQPSSAPPAPGSVRGGGAAVAVTGTGWGRNALLNKFVDADGHPGVGAGGAAGFGRSSLLAALSVPAPLSPSLSAAVAAAAPAAASSGWGRKSILASQSISTPPPPPPQQPVQPPSSADGARFHQPSPGGRRALIAELMTENDDGGSGGAAGMYGLQSYRGRSSHRGSVGGKARSQSVGGIGRPNGGSRGNTSDRVAKLDAGSWIYILGASASSTRAKQLASALQLDPRTGLPAL